jgi:hypothetical protein
MTWPTWHGSLVFGLTGGALIAMTIPLFFVRTVWIAEQSQLWSSSFLLRTQSLPIFRTLTKRPRDSCFCGQIGLTPDKNDI